MFSWPSHHRTKQKPLPLLEIVLKEEDSSRWWDKCESNWNCCHHFSGSLELLDFSHLLRTHSHLWPSWSSPQDINKVGGTFSPVNFYFSILRHKSPQHRGLPPKLEFCMFSIRAESLVHMHGTSFDSKPNQYQLIRPLFEVTSTAKHGICSCWLPWEAIYLFFCLIRHLKVIWWPTHM